MELTIEEFCIKLEKDNLAHWAGKFRDHPILSYIIELESSIDIKILWEWCKENCRGRYTVYNEYYALFELVEDAVAFKLRWM